MMSTLRKMKGRSVAELADRGRQKAAIVAELVGASPDLRLPPDRVLTGVFGCPENPTAADLLMGFREAGAERLFPVFLDPASAVQALRRSFPAEEARIVREAEKIVSGRYDLLGFRDLQFGGRIPNWHLEPVSQKYSPVRHWSLIDENESSETGDKKIVWELNRHQYFTVLGRAYLLTGDELYTRTFQEHVEDWITSNPPKKGVNWVSSLEIALRSISWVWALGFFRDSPELRAGTFLRVVKSLYLNARHLERHLSTYSSPNTHLTGEALGLFVLGRFLAPLSDARRWRELGLKILERAAFTQIRGDGGYVEQAVHYHRYTADIYLFTLLLLETEEPATDNTLKRRVHSLLKFLMHLTQPNGEVPQVGDDDGGRLHFFDDRSYADPRSTLALGAVLYSDPHLKFVAGDPSAELIWLGGSEGLEAFQSLDTRAPSDCIKGFEDSGFYTVRGAWDSNSDFLLVDCGPHGFMNGGHAHADALSFVLSPKGEPVFVDSGTYVYTADKASRDAFRSTAAHNCMTVNGESSSVPAGAFSWKTQARTCVLDWSISDESVLLRGCHDGFARFGVRYEREFQVFPGEGFSITDRVRTDSKNGFELNFILAPSVDCRVENGQAVVLTVGSGKRHRLEVVITTDEPGSVSVFGWSILPTRVSPRYGAAVESRKLVFSIAGTGGFELETSLRTDGE